MSPTPTEPGSSARTPPNAPGLQGKSLLPGSPARTGTAQPDHFEWVGEPIRPQTTEADTRPLSSGEPAAPVSFEWRGRTFLTAAVLARWKEHGDCQHGSGERYLRKHWFQIQTTDGSTFRLYFERQSRPARRDRWWLFSRKAAAAAENPG